VKAKWRREEVLTSFDEKEKKIEKNFVQSFSGRSLTNPVPML
jgi:hypothetical protein